LWKAGKAIFKFFEELKWAKAILRGAEQAAEAAKAAAAAAAKAAAEKAAKIKAAAEAATKKAAAEAAARAKALAAKAKAATKKGAGKADDTAKSSADDVGKSCPLPRRNSFVGGTAVVLADGSSKPIEQTEPGDTVLATDPISGQIAARQVTHSIRTDSDSEFVDLTIDDSDTTKDRTITTTEHHPFWSVTRGKWVDAGDLRSGELLRTSAGDHVHIRTIRGYQAELVTYDLTVDISHTYYVTVGNTSALVHNCGKDQGIYEFPDQHNPGQTYVGKSINLTTACRITSTAVGWPVWTTLGSPMCVGARTTCSSQSTCASRNCGSGASRCRTTSRRQASRNSGSGCSRCCRVRRTGSDHGG
jgi:Pretoxin HINT domain